MNIEELYKLAVKKRACKEGLDWLKEQNSINCINSKESVKEERYWLWIVKHIPEARNILSRVDIDLLDDECKYFYCFLIKDIKEVWSAIEDDDYKYLYCKDVCNREEVWRTIKGDSCKYLYCRYVEDREELWTNIKYDDYKELYCNKVKNRKELKELK